MADKVVIKGSTYKLRASAPMPIGGGKFITQTFMSELTNIDNYLYTKELPASSEFRGQGGPYIRANFSRLLDKGGNTFSGKVEYNPIFIEEVLL